jgi:dUTP pyrophosphatase
MNRKNALSPMVEVKAMRLSHGQGLPLPQYQTEEAAGLDLLAAVPLASPVRLLPGTRALVPTGLTLEIPAGYEGQIRARSGLALNHGVTVLNSPGTIDADYRGEVKVLLINHGRETFVITRGQRIAQLVIQAVARAQILDVRSLAASRRGTAGFGSTGTAVKKPPAPVASKPVAAKPAPAVAKPAVAAKPAAPAKPLVVAKKPAPAKAVPAAAAAKSKPDPNVKAKKPVVPKPAPAAKAKSAART